VGHTLWVRVRLDAWRTAGQVARDHLGMRWFDFLSAIDWKPSPYGRYEDDGLVLPDPVAVDSYETGYAGGDTRFQVFSRLNNPTDDFGITFKADLPDDDLAVRTLVHLFLGANWHEREAMEMFGFAFTGHPYPEKLYLPGAFEGFPLRKDFPLLSRMVKPWPGIVDVEPMPGGDDEEADDAAEAPT
jgi:NADH-quinone oxidoreductase subunit C